MAMTGASKIGANMGKCATAFARKPIRVPAAMARAFSGSAGLATRPGISGSNRTVRNGSVSMPDQPIVRSHAISDAVLPLGLLGALAAIITTHRLRIDSSSAHRLTGISPTRCIIWPSRVSRSGVPILPPTSLRIAGASWAHCSYICSPCPSRWGSGCLRSQASRAAHLRSSGSCAVSVYLAAPSSPVDAPGHSSDPRRVP